jgi:hypothetical protein
MEGEIAPAPKQGSAPWFSSVIPHISVVAQGLGVLGVIVYVLGYIAVNTYFSQYGVANKGLLNASYLPAGVIIILILGLFAVLVATRIYGMDETGRAIARVRPSWAPVIVWWAIILIWLFSSIIFSIAAATSLVMITFLHESASWLSAPLVIYFFVDFQLQFFRVYHRFPTSGLFVSMVAYVATVWLAASHAHDTIFPFFFWSLCGLAMGTLVLMEADKMSKGSKVSRVIAGCSALAGIAIFFGEKVYVKIPQTLGGGRPTTVQLLISSQNAGTVRGLLNLQSTISEDLELLGEDSDELILLTKSSDGTERPFRLSKKLVDGIVPKTKLPLKAPPAALPPPLIGSKCNSPCP